MSIYFYNSLSGARCPAYDVAGNLPDVAETVSLRARSQSK